MNQIDIVDVVKGLGSLLQLEGTTLPKEAVFKQIVSAINGILPDGMRLYQFPPKVKKWKLTLKNEGQFHFKRDGL